MAVIKPFRAVRYNPEFIVDYRGVVTPPYDLIDPCHRQKYHEASPYNSIRLILGLDRNGDHHGENRFIRAARCWRRWRAEEILIQDEQPGFMFTSNNSPSPRRIRRLDWICLLSWRSRTRSSCPMRGLSRGQADLLRLLEETQANFSQIFCFYEDGSGSVDDLPAGPDQMEPTIEVTDEEVTHRLWPIYNPAIISYLQSYLPTSRYSSPTATTVTSPLEYSRRQAAPISPTITF